MTSSVSRAVAFVTTPTAPRSFQARMLFEPIDPTSARSASSITSALPGPKEIGEGLGRQRVVPLAGPAVVVVERALSRGGPLRRDVAGRHGDPDEAVAEGLRVLPERPNLGIHEPDVLEPDRVHAVRDVRHAQALEEREQLRVFLRGEDGRRDVALAGAERGVGLGMRHARDEGDRCAERDDRRSPDGSRDVPHCCELTFSLLPSSTHPWRQRPGRSGSSVPATRRSAGAAPARRRRRRSGR